MWDDLSRFQDDGIAPVSTEWLTRSSNGDPAQAKLRHWICQPTKRYLWTPADTIMFEPALLSKVYGDGRALMGLTTINNRPAFYVVRIDSSWIVGMDRDTPRGAPEFVEFHEDICLSLEEEFGRREADEEETDPLVIEDGHPWPAFDDRDGSSWWRMEWPPLLGLAFEPHPYSWQANLLGPNNGAMT